MLKRLFRGYPVTYLMYSPLCEHKKGINFKFALNQKTIAINITHSMKQSFLFSEFDTIENGEKF